MSEERRFLITWTCYDYSESSIRMENSFQNKGTDLRLKNERYYAINFEKANRMLST